MYVFIIIGKPNKERKLKRVFLTYIKCYRAAFICECYYMFNNNNKTRMCSGRVCISS